MRKVYYLFIIFSLLLTSCNLPSGRSSTPTPDVVASQVALILTSQPTPEPASPTSAVPTGNPSATTEPSSTPQATQTATISPSDPREFLGNPDYVDTLDTGKSFGLEGSNYEDDNTLIRVENGSLILTSKYATGYRGWRTGGTKLKDAYIEAPMHIGDCSGMDTYGLVYRSPDFVKGYWFQLTCAGDWGFGYWDGSQYVNLKDGSNEHNAILTGSNQTNRIGVMTSGSDHKLYANGILIAEVQDSTFTDAGSYGAVIAAFSTPNLTVSITEFDTWNLQ